MNIGLIDVDSHGWPNLALMKISAYHKRKGDNVEFALPMQHYDIVYQSKVFDETYSKDIDWTPLADKIIKGGRGYDPKAKLPDEIEHIMPDYELYGIKDTAYGYLTRGCPHNHAYCCVPEMEGRCSHKVADLSEWWDGQRNIMLMDPNLLACKDRMELLDQLAASKAYVDFNQGLDIRLTNKEIAEKLGGIRVKALHFAWDDPKENLEPQFRRFGEWYKRKDPSRKIVYMLTNFDSTHEEDLYRVYKLKEMGFLPDVRIYDKPHAPRETLMLQRWVNNRVVFGSVERFEDYDPRKEHMKEEHHEPEN